MVHGCEHRHAIRHYLTAACRVSNLTLTRNDSCLCGEEQTSIEGDGLRIIRRETAYVRLPGTSDKDVSAGIAVRSCMHAV